MRPCLRARESVQICVHCQPYIFIGLTDSKCPALFCSSIDFPNGDFLHRHETQVNLVSFPSYDGVMDIATILLTKKQYEQVLLFMRRLSKKYLVLHGIAKFETDTNTR